MVATLYLNRRFIWQRSLLELRHRYADTGFGVVWNLLHPLSMIAVYSLVFGMIKPQVFADITAPYAIYLCAGLLPWIGFSDCITRGTQAFVQNAAYLKKLPVPEQAFVAQSALTATLNLALSFGLLVIICLIWRVPLSWHWLLLPVPLLLLQLAGLGIGMAAGTINVFLPDLGQAVPVVLRLAMWLAPVIFPMSFYDEHGLGGLILLNPATAPITAVRDLMFHQQWPPGSTWLLMAAWVVVSWLAGVLILRALKREIREVL